MEFLLPVYNLGYFQSLLHLCSNSRLQKLTEFRTGKISAYSRAQIENFHVKLFVNKLYKFNIFISYKLPAFLLPLTNPTRSLDATSTVFLVLKEISCSYDTALNFMMYLDNLSLQTSELQNNKSKNPYILAYLAKCPMTL